MTTDGYSQDDGPSSSGSRRRQAGSRMATPAWAGPVSIRAALSASEIEALARRCPQQALSAGMCLFRQGDPLGSVYVVRQGIIGLGQRVKGRRLTFLLMGEGEVVGDEALLLDTPASFDAFAVSDAVVVAVPAAIFLQAVDLGSGFARRWVVGVTRRLGALHARLEELLAGDLRSQVAALLLHQLARSKTVSLTQQTIADLLGVQRSSVGRVLRDLEQLGVLDVGYGHIAVRDRRTLAVLAGIAGDSNRAGA
jgi:CRP-like cAMP-binding protein